MSEDRITISKIKLMQFVDVVNNSDCNCEEIKIPLCGRCQVRWQLKEVLDSSSKKEEFVKSMEKEQ